jgi:hypothetical protein
MALRVGYNIGHDGYRTVAFLVEDFAERWFASRALWCSSADNRHAALGIDLPPRGKRPRFGRLRRTYGVSSGIAVVPGLSDGATISAGLIAGARRKDAFRLSFLLSLPAIAGATLIQCLKMESIDGFITALPSGWLVGCILASASGYLALVS